MTTRDNDKTVYLINAALNEESKDKAFAMQKAQVGMKEVPLPVTMGWTSTMGSICVQNKMFKEGEVYVKKYLALNPGVVSLIVAAALADLSKCEMVSDPQTAIKTMVRAIDMYDRFLHASESDSAACCGRLADLFVQLRSPLQALPYAQRAYEVTFVML